MKKKDKIYIAGHTGLVGSALVQRLTRDGFTNIIMPALSELDLTNQEAVKVFFKKEQPDYVFLTAARVGGIMANDLEPVDFIYPNLLIACNVINSAWEAKIKKLLFLGCACVYPRDCEQPIKEEYLLSAKPEPTNLAHAIAKIAAIVMCQSYNKQYKTNFISCVSSNIFGPNDNFNLNSGHVAAALISKIHSAKLKNEPTVTIWGTGKPRRDFIFVEDLIDACLFLMHNFDSSEPINLSAGNHASIRELAELIKELIGYKGKIEFDDTKPDGMPSKLLDNTRLASLGWKPQFGLKQGLEETYRWYLTFKNQRKRGS